MASFPSNVLEAAAVESLLRMNAEQLNRDECDGASDVLFGIYSAGINVKESNKIANRSGMDFYRPKGNLSIPLSTPDDADYLSPLQCYIRKHCVEYFEATDADNSNSSSKHKQQRGRRTPIVIGRVGIRCVFCKDCPFSQRASQSTAFPSNLEKIYSSVVVSTHIVALRIHVLSLLFSFTDSSPTSFFRTEDVAMPPCTPMP